MAFTRGFTRRDRSDPRLPPGQYNTGDGWPVLSYEPTPRLDTATWTFSIDGLVENPQTWSWADLHHMPPSTYEGDIHCVTTWSKFDMTFNGVSVDTLLDLAGLRAEAAFVMARSHTGYTTNLPLADVTGGKAWVAWTVDGKPLPVEHGGPARLLVPHLYFWKSAKWIRGLVMQADDDPGFWEQYGYHLHGDPWREERYS